MVIFFVTNGAPCPQGAQATIPRLGEAKIRHLDNGNFSKLLLADEDVLQFEVSMTQLQWR